MCKLCNPNRLEMMRITGIFFGYPKCCIDFFIERTRAILDSTTKKEFIDAQYLTPAQQQFHAGFIPCPECAETVDNKTIKNLIKNRICSLEYPFGKNEDEFEKFLLNIKQTKTHE